MLAVTGRRDECRAALAITQHPRLAPAPPGLSPFAVTILQVLLLLFLSDVLLVPKHPGQHSAAQRAAGAATHPVSEPSREGGAALERKKGIIHPWAWVEEAGGLQARGQLWMLQTDSMR